MTEDKLHEIVRAWLRDAVKTAGSMRKLAAATGIKHPQISAALDEEEGGQVSWLMLARISTLPGMSMGRVFDQLAGRCHAAEGVTSEQKRVASGPVPARAAADEAAEAAREIEALRAGATRAGKREPKGTRSPGR